jgi:hypothetical protein
MRLIQYLLIGLCLNNAKSFLASRKTSTLGHGNVQRNNCGSSSLFATGDLPTAYEWLAEEKEFELEWLNPASVLDNEVADCESNVDSITMPLYPLEACYLPLSEEKIDEKDYAIIRNVEPQNIKMALDLEQQMEEHGSARFCAVLKANDTGRVATVATIMRIVNIDVQYLWDGKTIARIVLKCIPEQRADVLNIINPKAWGRENRLRRSDEYLMANVARFEDCNELEKISDSSTSASEILVDYEAIKNIYETDNRASCNLPPFAIDAISSLPQMKPITDDDSFWLAAHLWQKLCCTMKEAKRVNLQAIVNEKTISAALKKGGPLNLPIHREDLPSDVRIELNQLENDAADDFIKIGMDPCIDFQNLLATKGKLNRMNLLQQMISKERIRLENEVCTRKPN